MKISKAGREYVTWQVSAPDDEPLEVSFDGGATWHLMERTTVTVVEHHPGFLPQTVEVPAARVLVAGPDATSNPPGTVVLTRGSCTAMIRLTDTPEVVVREAGTFYLTGY